MSHVEFRKPRLALRMDDVGASSKRYEIYSNIKKKVKGIKVFDGNWLFFKYMRPFRAWGPYRELRASEWWESFDLLESFDGKLTVAVTAAWVERSGELTPYPERFPDAAAVLQDPVVFLRNQSLFKRNNQPWVATRDGNL